MTPRSAPWAKRKSPRDHLRLFPSFSEEPVPPFTGSHVTEDFILRIREESQLIKACQGNPQDIPKNGIGVRLDLAGPDPRGQDQIEHVAVMVGGDGIHDPKEVTHLDLKAGLLKQLTLQSLLHRLSIFHSSARKQPIPLSTLLMLGQQDLVFSEDDSRYTDTGRFGGIIGHERSPFVRRKGEA
jgi:hypothetical protein